MADPVTAGLLIGAAGVQIYGQVKGANAEAAAMEVDAQFKREQAEEVDRKARSAVDFMERDISTQAANIISSAAAGNVDSTSGSTLDVLEDTLTWMHREVSEYQKGEAFASAQLRKGADLQDAQARDTRKAGVIGGITAGLAGGAKAYGSIKASTNDGKTTGLKKT